MHLLRISKILNLARLQYFFTKRKKNKLTNTNVALTVIVLFIVLVVVVVVKNKENGWLVAENVAVTV